jgi:hypothetical protein
MATVNLIGVSLLSSALVLIFECCFCFFFLCVDCSFYKKAQCFTSQSRVQREPRIHRISMETILFLESIVPFYSYHAIQT